MLCKCGHERWEHVLSRLNCNALADVACPCTSYRETQEENMTTSDTLEQEAAEFVAANVSRRDWTQTTDYLVPFARLKVEQAKKQIADDLEKILGKGKVPTQADLYIEQLRGNYGK